MGVGRFGARLVSFENGVKGILKTSSELNEFRGVPRSEMAKREVAAYLLDSEILHFGVVPQTALVNHEGRAASLQEFCEWKMPEALVPSLFKTKREGWDEQLEQFDLLVDHGDLTKVVVLDLLMNNVDRNGKNLLVNAEDGRVRAIDNGASFGHAFNHYRQVFHRYLFYEELTLSRSIIERLEAIDFQELEVLRPFLTELELQETWLRLQFILQRRSCLEWKTFSGGKSMASKRIPDYSDWFQAEAARLAA